MSDKDCDMCGDYSDMECNICGDDICSEDCMDDHLEEYHGSGGDEH